MSIKKKEEIEIKIFNLPGMPKGQYLERKGRRAVLKKIVKEQKTKEGDTK